MKVYDSKIRYIKSLMFADSFIKLTHLKRATYPTSEGGMEVRIGLNRDHPSHYVVLSQNMSPDSRVDTYGVVLPRVESDSTLERYAEEGAYLLAGFWWDQLFESGKIDMHGYLKNN